MLHVFGKGVGGILHVGWVENSGRGQEGDAGAVLGRTHSEAACLYGDIERLGQHEGFAINVTMCGFLHLKVELLEAHGSDVGATIDGFIEEHGGEADGFHLREGVHNDEVEEPIGDACVGRNDGVIAKLRCVGKGNHECLYPHRFAIDVNGVPVGFILEKELRRGAYVVRHAAGFKLVEEPAHLGIKANAGGGKEVAAIDSTAIHGDGDAVERNVERGGCGERNAEVPCEAIAGARGHNGEWDVRVE